MANELHVHKLIFALTGADPDARKEAADLLGTMASPEATAALINALRHPLVDIRLCAAEALGQVEDDAVINSLIDALDGDPSPNMRQCAARSLGRIGRADALAALLDALDDAPNVCRAAARALGEIGDTRVVPNLITLVEKHQDALIRQVSAVALGDLRDVDALPALVGALSDPSWVARQAACEALGKIGDKSAVLALVDALEDRHQAVRLAATDAIARLSGGDG
jgi:HEAT repeat protein